MKQLSNDTIPAAPAKRSGRARIGLLALAVVFAVLGGIGFQYYHSVQARRAADAKAAVALSGSTTTVLNGLRSPVEIRFYSLLDPASTPDALRAYAKRVDAVLAEYERAGNGNIRVVRYDALTDANANAATADGIHSFNREKGEACYLGIAASSDGQTKSIAELSPDWEQALESDLSRVVAQVNETKAPAAAPGNVSAGELAAAEQANQANPALASASLSDGTQMLRDAALAEFKKAVAEMQERTQQAEQSVSQGTSPADVAKQLEKIRAEQTQKMQEITARLHNQIVAFQQSRTAGH
jgi:hypothetical protein